MNLNFWIRAGNIVLHQRQFGVWGKNPRHLKSPATGYSNSIKKSKQKFQTKTWNCFRSPSESMMRKLIDCRLKRAMHLPDTTVYLGLLDSIKESIDSSQILLYTYI
jgi:hypothetical protein